MIKAIEIRLYPNNEQQKYLNNIFGCYRKVYNLALAKSISEYENGKKLTNLKEFSNYFHKELLKDDNFSYLKEHNTKILKDSLSNLSIAFKNYFKKYNKDVGLPNFKSKNNEQSIGVYNEAFSKKLLYKENYIFISNKFGNIKYKTSLEYKEILNNYKDDIIRLTIKKTKTNKYFAKIIIDYKGSNNKTDKVNDVIGVDLGVKDFIITSLGEVVTNDKLYIKYQKKLKRLQKQFSRKELLNTNEKYFNKKYNKEIIKKISSKNRDKNKLKITKIHEKIRNLKKETLHKVTSSLVNENQVIVIEDLNVKGMIKNHNLAKSIINSNFGEFKEMLKYKCSWYGTELIIADRFFPSSKLCSSCGTKNVNLQLKDREWTCNSCGTTHNRDFNAAVNLENYGRSIIGRRCPEFKFVETSSVDDPLLVTTIAKKHLVNETNKIQCNTI
jgi:putative transposase